MKLSFAELSALTRHRAPFLFVRSAEIAGDNEIRGVCGWDADNPIFAGHFPDCPLVPAVLLVDAAAQLAGIHIAHRFSIDVHGPNSPLSVLTTIRKVTVHQPVFPGDEIDYRVMLEEPVGQMFGVRAEGFSPGGEQRIFKCELVLASVEKSRLLADRG